jgi:hypothetical protein
MYKIRPFPGFKYRTWNLLFSDSDGFEEPCHVTPDNGHDLQSFFIFKELFGGISMDDIPVNAWSDYHLSQIEVVVKLMENPDAPGTPEGRCNSPNLVAQIGAGEKEPVQEGLEGSGDPPVIRGRTQNDPIGAGKFFRTAIYQIVVKNALSQFPAFSAVDTAPNFLVSHMNKLHGDAVFFQFPGQNG